eukprot:1200085-Pyramimonas_sp.AAC.1
MDDAKRAQNFSTRHAPQDIERLLSAATGRLSRTLAKEGRGLSNGKTNRLIQLARPGSYAFLQPRGICDAASPS